MANSAWNATDFPDINEPFSLKAYQTYKQLSGSGLSQDNMAALLNPASATYNDLPSTFSDAASLKATNNASFGGDYSWSQGMDDRGVWNKMINQKDGQDDSDEGKGEGKTETQNETTEVTAEDKAMAVGQALKEMSTWEIFGGGPIGRRVG